MSKKNQKQNESAPTSEGANLPAAEQTFKHKVTAQDIANNPDAGLVEGEEIEVPLEGGELNLTGSSDTTGPAPEVPEQTEQQKFNEEQAENLSPDEKKEDENKALVIENKLEEEGTIQETPGEETPAEVPATQRNSTLHQQRRDWNK